MSAFSPLPVRYSIPHGRFNKQYTGDVIPQQTSVFTMGPCACCYHEIYLQPQFTAKDWAIHGQAFNPVHYRQLSNAVEENPEKKQIEHKKPKLSYVELIAGAILSSPQKHLVLGDIYEAIAEKYPFFETRGSGWRNSIRHNLSLSDCFIKGERSPNGKGHFWEVNLEYYGGNGAKGKSKMNKKKLGSRQTTKNEIKHYELNPEKELKKESLTSVNPNGQKLSLLTQLGFDEEIREFEIARKKLTEVRTARD